MCLNCDKEVLQANGKRVKLYCDNRCKMQYLRKNKGIAVKEIKQDKQTPSVESDLRPQIVTDHIVTTPHIVTKSYRNNDNVTNIDNHIVIPAVKTKPDTVIPPCPRGINPNVWTMQHELKAGYQYKGRQAQQVAI